jgi:hypothetical protein
MASNDTDHDGDTDDVTALLDAPSTDRLVDTAGGAARLTGWRRSRPLVGGVLMVLASFELYFAPQPDAGGLHVQVGIEGFQATLIPVVIALTGVLAVLMPAHRIFYGVIGLAVAVYSLVGDNLGGFFVGMLLASAGGVMVVSWMPRTARQGTAEAAAGGGDPASSDDGEDGGRRRRRRLTSGTLVVVLTLTAATGLVATQPTRASAAEPGGGAPAAVRTVCILGILGDCSTPAPAPSPTTSGSSAPSPGTGTGGGPSGGASSGAPASTGGAGGSIGPIGPTPAATPSGPTLIAPASAAPVFSGKPALLQGSSLSFSGLRYLGLARVRLSDGSTQTVLELSMDDVTIPGFRLDTRDAAGTGVDTVATSMAFSGGVTTYLSSLQGVLDNGAAVKYDVEHPPSTDGSVPVGRILSLEVYGIVGGSSALTGFHEMIG